MIVVLRWTAPSHLILLRISYRAMKMTIEMASNAYKNEEGIVGVPTGLSDLDGRLLL